MANPKLSMLQNMLLGIPTAETQEMAVKNVLYADPNTRGQYDAQLIQEMANNAPMPDMTGVQGTAVVGGSLPPVAEDDIMSLLQGKRPQPRQQTPQRQQQVVRQLVNEHIAESRGAEAVLDDPYWGGGAAAKPQRRAMSPDADREDTSEYSVHEMLAQKLAKRRQSPLQEQARPKAAPARRAASAPVESDFDDDLEDRIEDIVYKVLAQIVNEAVRRKMGI